MSAQLQSRLESLFEVARLLASEEDLDALLERILTEVHGVMAANAASLLLRVPGTDSLEFVETRGHVAEKIHEKRIRIGEGISGEVGRTGKTINVVDAYLDKRFNDSFDRLSGFRTTQILAMPMLYKEEVVGVMSVMNKKNDTAFDEDDERILRIFCDQASIAVINAQERRRYSKKNSAQTVFAREVGVILSSELTLVHGYLHMARKQSAQLLSAHLLPVEQGNAEQGKVEKFSKLENALLHIERSADSMVVLAKTIGSFTRAARAIPGKFSCQAFLLQFLKETKYHAVRVCVWGEPRACIHSSEEGVFLVIESLLQLLQSVLKRAGHANPLQQIMLVYRERIGQVDFCVCLEEDPNQSGLSLSPTALKDDQKDDQSHLAIATLESIIDTLNADLLDFESLTRTRTQKISLSGASLLSASLTSESAKEFPLNGHVAWQLSFAIYNPLAAADLGKQ